MTGGRYQYEIREAPTPDTPGEKERFSNLVHEMAEDGWRFVETVPSSQRKYGQLVVFERELHTGEEQ